MSEFVEDIRAKVIDRITASLSISEDVAGMIAAEIVASICRDWRGDRPYIGPPAEEKSYLSTRDAAIRRDNERGESVALLARRYGLSRKRIWAITSRKVSRITP